LSYYPKTCNFTICSIFSNSGHVGWCTASPDTIFKLDTLVMIQTKFDFNWSSSFRGEDFWKSLRRTTDAKWWQKLKVTITPLPIWWVPPSPLYQSDGYPHHPFTNLMGNPITPSPIWLLW
jgi:hypothetical protein